MSDLTITRSLSPATRIPDENGVCREQSCCRGGNQGGALNDSKASLFSCDQTSAKSVGWGPTHDLRSLVHVSDAMRDWVEFPYRLLFAVIPIMEVEAD